MTAPTLPVIGVTPSVAFFHTLELLALGLILAFFVGAVLSSFLLTYAAVLVPLIAYICSNQTPRQHHSDGCTRCMKTIFLFVGRQLCVYTFPALFKMHKTPSDHGRQLRKFMVFLDRKVGNSLILVTAFCAIVCSILCLSTMVFLQYFPVEVSAECLETDSHGQSLFCYLSNSSISSSSISNSSIIDPNLPVDCDHFSVTELRELQFECYAIAIPAGLSIAVAAALGLAKVAIVCVTFYVKVAEWFFTVTKNPPRKLQEACCCNCSNRQCVIRIYIYTSIFFLCTVAMFTLLCGILFVVEQDSIHAWYYIAYALLPLLIYFPLGIIIPYLSKHCDQGEYASIAADQRPPDPGDWDVESQSSVTSGQHDDDFGRERGNSINCESFDRAEGEHDEENFGSEGGRGNTKCEAEGARLTGTTSGASNRSYDATSPVASLHESV